MSSLRHRLVKRSGRRESRSSSLSGRGSGAAAARRRDTVTVHDSSSASDARRLSQDVPRSSDHRIQPHQVLGPFACGVDAPQPGAARPQRLRGLRGSRKLVRVAIDGHEGCRCRRAGRRSPYMENATRLRLLRKRSPGCVCDEVGRPVSTVWYPDTSLRLLN